MINSRIKAALVVLAASAGLSACTSLGYGGNGLGVGVGYGNQGYGSPYGYGYGSPYGYGYGSPYGYGYGSPYGFGSPYGGYPYYGWYDGYYYPGSGYWVYDPDGNQHPITQKQSSFWGSQLKKYREATGTTAQTQTAVTQNFSGFRSRAKTGASIPGVDLNAQAQADQASVRQISEVRRQARAERIQQAREQRATSTASQSDSGRSARQIIMESRRAKRGGGSDN